MRALYYYDIIPTLGKLIFIRYYIRRYMRAAVRINWYTPLGGGGVRINNIIIIISHTVITYVTTHIIVGI